MKLKSFRVKQFRSINDSGDVTLSFSNAKAGEDRSLTALVGRNESGKSNLLLALHTLNPPDGPKPLVMIKDFPRHLHQRDWNENFPFLSTKWDFEPKELEDLQKRSPAFARVASVGVSRNYKGTRFVDFHGVDTPNYDTAQHDRSLRSLGPIIKSLDAKIENDDDKASLEKALQALLAKTAPSTADAAWCKTLVAPSSALREAVGAVGLALPDSADEILTSIERSASAVADFADIAHEARNQVIAWLPKFIYVADFPEIAGYQNLEELLFEKSPHHPYPSKERENFEDWQLNFKKMAKVSGFEPKQVHELGKEGKHEERGQILNRASAYLTGQLKKRWKDRPLKVRFDVDGPHLVTTVSDPNSEFDVEVNLDERSRGMRWFFAFYVTFAADTDGGDADGAILLLDEPGLFLHALSQGDLIRHFQADFSNQIIFTTHSPFMVPPDDIASARTVNIDPEKGTTVTNEPSGDSKTLFPLQAALGWTLAQSLFIGPKNIVVEGISDYWYLNLASQWLKENGGGIPGDVALTPAGGAGKVPYMVALLTGQDLKVSVILDADKAGQDARRDLVGNLGMRAKSVISVADAFDDGRTDADMEDMFEPSFFEALVKDAYAKELKGKALKPKPAVPRIVKRYELAFEEVGLSFNKMRVARHLLDGWGQRASDAMSATAQSRFKALIKRSVDALG